MLLPCVFVLALQASQVCPSVVVYPEIQPHLQKYQDFGWGFPAIGEWILVQRNYYEDLLFGAEVRGIKYQRYGRNTAHNTPIVITYQDGTKVSARLTIGSSEGYQAKNLIRIDFCHSNYSIEAHLIFWEPFNCLIIRHPYVDNGLGCSYWRHVAALKKPDDCCQFIYAENCGTSPRYQIYDDLSCSPGRTCRPPRIN
ncbi:uncharacterized protein LOC119165696 [Rhipicephalus microplus]|uniref:uncharacterized protein LOC119165696 n=1 Tax=Rhipicephalus microplus TaxID=6941 RepID=UPI003F6C20E5